MKLTFTRIASFIFCLLIVSSCDKETEISSVQDQDQVITVSTFAGCGDAGFLDASAKNARFNQPSGIAVDKNGNVYIADQINHRIRKITPSGSVSTLAGNGKPGYKDGKGTAAQFDSPVGIAVDKNGFVYVADFVNNRIRKISPSGTVTTLAGDGAYGFADGEGAIAQFASPIGIAVAQQGIVYVTDLDNNLIRKITADGIVSTFAGNGLQGTTDGEALTAQFFGPNGITIDEEGTIYIAEEGNHNIRKITPDGNVSTIAGNGNPGYVNGIGTEAQFMSPNGITVDKSGNLYVADWFNNRIRKITPAGAVSTMAGSGPTGFGNGYKDGDGQSARFNFPRGITMDNKGDFYVADQLNNRIRKITVE